ncbi:hypothetical protein [Bdellovibrio sp. HCB337]|uniref:hypothetical protein n=1 Tax=Bdellovibrio sp. HCB337 TaxID=3394358 RepID=UPI0039A43641
MAKISSKHIVKALKEKEKSEEKANITFRLNVDLLNSFREKCKKEDVSMASVIEMLLKDFIDN